MTQLSYTLVSDGSTDQALLPILTWSLLRNHVSCAIQPSWADLRRLPRPPRTFADRLILGVSLYPCDLLFVHRDAEKAPMGKRVDEIKMAVEEAAGRAQMPAHVCVVPVRMQEAWLLFDETAIRRAAGNPNGRQVLRLPPLTTLEQIPDPKDALYDLLGKASGLQGRRRKQLQLSACAMLVSQFAVDYAPLLELPAFKALQEAVAEAVGRGGWHE